MKNLNITPIIPPNKRNTKNENKLKKLQLETKQKQIYKKRISIENSFCYLQKNRRCQIIYDVFYE